MAEATYLMGIDFGTGGVRVGLFDRTGTPAGFAAAELRTRHPRPGWAEQDPGSSPTRRCRWRLGSTGTGGPPWPAAATHDSARWTGKPSLASRRRCGRSARRSPGAGSRPRRPERWVLVAAARAGWSTVAGQRRAWPAASRCHPCTSPSARKSRRLPPRGPWSGLGRRPTTPAPLSSRPTPQLSARSRPCWRHGDTRRPGSSRSGAGRGGRARRPGAGRPGTAGPGSPPTPPRLPTPPPATPFRSPRVSRRQPASPGASGSGRTVERGRRTHVVAVGAAIIRGGRRPAARPPVLGGRGLAIQLGQARLLGRRPLEAVAPATACSITPRWRTPGHPRCPAWRAPPATDGRRSR
jgi:hypothetical protein